MIDYEALKARANEEERRVVDAVQQFGSNRAAAPHVGLHHSNVARLLHRLKSEAANDDTYAGPDLGFAPLAPVNARDGLDPYVLEKVTTAVNGQGEVERQWKKTRLDQQMWMEAVKAGVHAFLEESAPIIPPMGPMDFQTDIIPWIQIGDAHLGMLAHAAEVGENFDLKIAERELCGAIGILIDELPDCERIVVNDLGDFTHYENFAGVTEASGHALDLDTRFPKMIKTYSRVMRWIVDKALTKARFVDVIVNQGNHSRTNDVWMAELLDVKYGGTGRVNVLNNDNPFIGYRMGNTLVMTHHSDKCKPNRLAQVMTSDFREDYGQTEFHYIDVGHVHHGMVMKEHPDIVIESWNHLASLDRWAHDNGYRNRKSITIVYRSRKYGEINRRLLPIQQVRDILNLQSMPKMKKAFVA